jgi:hypothetical protein
VNDVLDLYSLVDLAIFANPVGQLGSNLHVEGDQVVVQLARSQLHLVAYELYRYIHDIKFEVFPIDDLNDEKPNDLLRELDAEQE